MRDGQGNKLSSEEAEKVKAAVTPKDDASLNVVSVDPKAGEKPASGTEPPKSPTQDHEPRF